MKSILSYAATVLLAGQALAHPVQVAKRADIDATILQFALTVSLFPFSSVKLV